MNYAKWNRLGAALIDLWLGYAFLELLVFIIVLIPGAPHLFALTYSNLIVDFLILILNILLAIFGLAMSNTLMTYFFSNTFGKFILRVNVIFTDDESMKKTKKRIKGKKKKNIKKSKNKKPAEVSVKKPKQTRRDRNFVKIFKREFLKYYYFVCTFTLYGIYCIILILRGKFVLPHDKKSHTKVG